MIIEHEWKWKWKKAAVAQFKVLSQNMAGGTERTAKGAGMMAYRQAEIWTRNFQDTKQQC
jgi:hypothetical protein